MNVREQLMCTDIEFNNRRIQEHTTCFFFIVKKEMRTMEEEVFKLFLQQGSWSILVGWLLWANNKRNEKCKDKYQTVIVKN